MIGSAPWIRTPAGKLVNAGRSFTRSSKNLLGRLVRAEVLALPMATSAEMGPVPSIRWKPSKWAPSSTTATATFHRFLTASVSQASRIFFTSDKDKQGLVRIGRSYGNLLYGFCWRVVTVARLERTPIQSNRRSTCLFLPHVPFGKTGFHFSGTWVKNF